MQDLAVKKAAEFVADNAKETKPKKEKAEKAEKAAE